MSKPGTARRAPTFFMHFVNFVVDGFSLVCNGGFIPHSLRSGVYNSQDRTQPAPTRAWHAAPLPQSNNLNFAVNRFSTWKMRYIPAKR